MALTTESWKTWAEQREIDEWLLSVAGLLETGWNDQFVSRLDILLSQGPDERRTDSPSNVHLDSTSSQRVIAPSSDQRDSSLGKSISLIHISPYVRPSPETLD